MIFVGDATMSPYEISVTRRLGRAHERGGRARLWLQRVTDIYEHCVWLNPMPEDALGLDAVHRS